MKNNMEKSTYEQIDKMFAGPTKRNHAGNQQPYVPSGHGDESGEYADQVGSNIHFSNGQIQEYDNKKPKSSKLKKLEEFAKNELYKQEFSKKNEEDEFSDLDLPEGIKENELSKLDDEEDEELFELEEPPYEEMLGLIEEDETKEAIFNLSDYELDKDKVNALDDKKAQKLLGAIETTSTYEDKKAKLQKKFSKTKYEGIWKEEQTIPSLLEKYNNNVDDVLKSLDEKQTWAENYKPELAIQISNLDKEALKQDLAKYQDKLNKLNAKNEKAQKLISKYENNDGLYSKYRKDNAVWCKSISETHSKFPDIQNVKGIKEDEINALKYYTQTFSYINEPLRGITYAYGTSSKQHEFITQVKNMTKAIDKSVIPFDFWTQRGTTKINFPNMSITGNTSIEDLEKLVGTEFVDQAFLSTGAAKNTGFTTSSIILNIYCPKGTKGAFVDNISHFKGENELILQRGYSYKVQKVEKKGDKIYMDVDLQLGSDKNKFNDEALKQIKEKYTHN